MKKFLFLAVYTLSLFVLVGGSFTVHKAMKKHKSKDLNWGRKSGTRGTKVEKPFVITVPSYRNAEYYEKNLRSIFEQKYSNYRVIYVDDASPDQTYEKVKEYVTEEDQWHRFTLLKNEKNRGAMYNHVQMSQYYRNDEIVVMLDGDDFFASDHVLQELNHYYANPDVWVTYGQYITYPDYKIGLCKPMRFSDLKKGNIRDLPWVTSALRTFYGGLFRRINVEDFLYEGSFLPMSCDLAYMFPIVEMAREHVYFTQDVSYIYNRETGLNDDIRSRSKQVFFEGLIRAKSRYAPLAEHPATENLETKGSSLDVVIVSSDRPYELSSTLTSLENNREGIQNIYVFYHPSHVKEKLLYDQLAEEFKGVSFISQNGQDGFRESFLDVLNELTTKEVLLLSEGTRLDGGISLKKCVEDLQRSHLFGYCLHLEKEKALDHQHVLPMHELGKGIYGVPFSASHQFAFEKTSGPYAMIYPKHVVKEWVDSMKHLTLVDFQKKWPFHHQGESRMVLCQEHLGVDLSMKEPLAI